MRKGKQPKDFGIYSTLRPTAMPLAYAEPLHLLLSHSLSRYALEFLFGRRMNRLSVYLVWSASGLGWVQSRNGAEDFFFDGPTHWVSEQK